MALKTQKAVFDSDQRLKVVWRKDFSLDDREIDFDLIQPTGMDGSMNETQIRPTTTQAYRDPGRTAHHADYTDEAGKGAANAEECSALAAC
jgi:hypothetical protein